MINRKRLGQFLIGGVLTVCTAVICALVDLVEEEQKKRADKPADAETEER